MKNRLLKINAILACIIFTLSITACTALFADLVTFPEAEPVVVADGEPIVSADQVDQVNKTITVSDEKVLKAEINEDGQLVVTPLKWGTAEVSFYDSENDADVTYEFKVTSKGEVVENSVNKKVRSYSITIQYYEGGTITVNKTSAHAGDTITLSVTTLDGYNFEGITVKQGSNTVALTENNTFKMPKGDVTVCATFAAIDYKITFGAMTNGSVTTDEATAHVGESIELNVTPNDGYQLGTITVTSNGQSVTVINNIFIMPAGNVTVNATFVLKEYSISISSSIANGTVTVDKTTAYAGETITLTANPAEGYQLEAYNVTSGEQSVTVSNNTFTMPKGDVIVSATFTAGSYTVSVDNDIANGSVTANPTTAHVGGIITLTSTPADGYQLGAYTVTSGEQTITVSNNTFTMPAGNVTVRATFTAIEYTVSVATMTHGSVTASKTTDVHVGDIITLTATPDDGYQFGAYTVTSGEQNITVSDNTFTMPAGNVTVSASFTAINYTVSVATMTHGSVTASKTTANVGEIITLTSTPADGYQLGIYTVISGGQQITVTNNKFTMPAGNVTITATFNAIGYTVSYGTMSNGSVTADKTTANVGEIITLTATPADGYQLGIYTVISGGQQITVTNNKFTMPAGNVTITATFNAIGYTVSYGTMSNGSVTASKTTANVGETITLTATPATGYNFGAFTVTSGEQTITVSNNTFTMPAGNVTVSATFTAINYTVSVATMTHGSVTASKTTANVGETVSLTATPNAGYNFGEYTVTSGGQAVTVTNNTFTMPAGNVSISATFTAINYTVGIAETISHGSVTASKTTDVHVGDEITLTATPAAGYNFGAYTVTSGGQTVTVTNNTFTMPAGNVTVSASFTAIGYTVSVATMTHGSVTASKTTANVGETITLTATPNAGYNFGEYTVTSGGQSVAVTNNTFTMPAGNVSISATFTAIDYTVAVATMTHGSVTASKTTANVGETITLTATPATGYNFGAYTVTSGGQNVTVTNNTFTMPAGNVTVSATFTAINYSITLPTSITGGTVTASKTSANVGETITLTATPAAGYNFGAYTVTSGGQTVTVSDNTFTMPAGNVTVSATFTAINYTVTVADNIEHGTVTTNKTTAHAGETVTLTVAPSTGYQLVTLSVKDSSNATITHTVDPNDSTKYTFTMPDTIVSVTATFESTSSAVTYSVGDVLLNTGTIIPHANVNTMTDDQKAAAVGVLYALDDEGTPRGWLGLYNSAGGTNSGYYTWAKSETTGYSTKIDNIVCVATGTTASTATFTGDTDGSDNWTEICTVDSTGASDAATNYPAFNYVNNYASTFNLTGDYATGWYMPSIAELCYIYRNKDSLNEVLNTLGGIQLDNSRYWSSSQDPYGSSSAWYVYLSDGGVGSSYKYLSRWVCCVRAF